MTPMLCQACENNETTVSVICDSCVSHYASIREGQYQERELVAGEATYVVHSWVHIDAPSHKKASREDKAGKKKGFFGKKATPEAEPAQEETPPPDWKNRVFPLPDPVTPAPAAGSAAVPAEAYTAPAETEFTYGADAGAGPDEAPVLDLAGEALALTLETAEPEVIAPTHISEIIAQAITAPPALPTEPEVAEPPAPALASFFESLSQPAPVAEPDVAAVEPAPAPAAELTNFFESLGQPPAPAVEPVAEAPPTSPDLSSFFASLSATPAAPSAAPAATPEPEPEIAALEEAATEVVITSLETPAAPEAGSSADLSSFFETLRQPAAPAVSFDSPPEPHAQATPEPIELPTASSPDLSTFFESLSAPVAEFQVPKGPHKGPEGPEPLWGPSPAVFEAPAPADPGTGAKPFSIELELPTASGAPGVAKPPADLKPPTIGTPFTIDLTPPSAHAPQARQTSESLELKRQLSSTGGLSFADDEDDDDAPTDGGLLSGLTYSGGASKSGGFEVVRDDDEDDERTIEL